MSVNKKADAPILVMVMLILALSLFTLFQFSKNKKTVDTLALDYGALDILYNRETQLQHQFTELAENSATSAYNKVMNTVIFVSEEGKFVEEVNNEILYKEFTQALNEELENYIKNQGELKEEIGQIKEALAQPNAVEFKNNEIIFLDLKNIKITLVSFDKQGKETFRGIYTTKITTNINLTELGLSKVSFDYFREIYAQCKNQDEKLSCLNKYLPQFTMIFKYDKGYKPGTQQGTITNPAPYNIEIVYLDLATKRKFLISKEYRPINFKIAVDASEP